MLALVLAATAVQLTVTGAILVYVVRIEQRLTRLETIDELRAAKALA